MHNHWRQFNSCNSKDTLYIIWFFQWFGCAFTNNCAGLYLRSVSEIWYTWTEVIYFYDHQLLNWYRKLCSTSFAYHSHLAHSSLILLGCSLSLSGIHMGTLALALRIASFSLFPVLKMLIDGVLWEYVQKWAQSKI